MTPRAEFVLKTALGLGVDILVLHGDLYAGPPVGMPDETWKAVHAALMQHEAEIVAFIRTCPTIGSSS
jgi:hypothetical protein